MDIEDSGHPHQKEWHGHSEIVKPKVQGRMSQLARVVLQSTPTFAREAYTLLKQRVKCLKARYFGAGTV